MGNVQAIADDIPTKTLSSGSVSINGTKWTKGMTLLEFEEENEFSPE